MIRSKQLTEDERAVTFTVEYVTTFLIALLLLTGVTPIFAGGANDIQHQTTQSEFDRIGAEVASAVETVDHHQSQHDTVESQTGITTDSKATVRLEVPEKVGGLSYWIRAEGNKIVIEPTRSSEVEARAEFPVDISGNVTANGGTPGGHVTISVNQTTGNIQIRPDSTSGAVAFKPNSLATSPLQGGHL